MFKLRPLKGLPMIHVFMKGSTFIAYVRIVMSQTQTFLLEAEKMQSKT